MSKGLSIIVPVYNEELGIKSTFDSIEKVLIDFKKNVEVIFIDDGSKDKTYEILKKCIYNKNKYKVYRHNINLGYGAALKTGIGKSNMDFIVITDADETYPNNRIVEFYNKSVQDDLDMLVGARVGSNAKIPLIRRPAKWALNQIANYLSEFKIPDLNSGLRVMKKKVLVKFLNILPDGFSFTTTITLAMLTNGYQVKYEPIEYFYRSGSSKIRPIYDTLNFIQLIIRTVLLFRPLKIFLPLSLIMFLIGFCLIFYRVLVGQSFGVTSTVIFVGAIQILAIGMLADLIDRKTN